MVHIRELLMVITVRGPNVTPSIHLAQRRNPNGMAEDYSATVTARIHILTLFLTSVQIAMKLCFGSVAFFCSQAYQCKPTAHG